MEFILPAFVDLHHFHRFFSGRGQSFFRYKAFPGIAPPLLPHIDLNSWAVPKTGRGKMIPPPFLITLAIGVKDHKELEAAQVLFIRLLNRLLEDFELEDLLPPS